MPVVGDWDGDGQDTLGVYRGWQFYLSNTLHCALSVFCDSNSGETIDLAPEFGGYGDSPIVADWNGDGTDTIGLVRGPTFLFRNSNSPGFADDSLDYGDPGDVPLTGDWNGDGTDTVAVYRPAPPPAELQPYRGLGTWVDVYDWSHTYSGNSPQFSLEDVDRMAFRGVQILYLQPVREQDPADILEADRVNAIITRAHLRGVRVVGWYLPELVDVANDLRHLDAMARLPLDGIAVDTEAQTVSDFDVRSQRLVALSHWYRATHPERVLSAIVRAPSQADLYNVYFGQLPWAELARDYQVWLPTAYYTSEGGPLRDAYTYVAENIKRLRYHVARPDAYVHPIGGIADGTNVGDVNGIARACNERGCLGSGLFDYGLTGNDLWAALQQFRR
jgi:hypothetical protein